MLVLNTLNLTVYYSFCPNIFSSLLLFLLNKNHVVKKKSKSSLFFYTFCNIQWNVYVPCTSMSIVRSIFFFSHVENILSKHDYIATSIIIIIIYNRKKKNKLMASAITDVHKFCKKGNYPSRLERDNSKYETRICSLLLAWLKSSYRNRLQSKVWQSLTSHSVAKDI